MNHKLLITTGALLLVGISSAQSRSSFVVVDAINFIIGSRAGNELTVEVGLNPSVKIGSKVYQVTEVFGAWLLDDNDDLNGTGATDGVWSFDRSLGGSGGIVGYKTNPNTGLLPDETKTFTFSTLTGTEEAFGYHVRFSENLPSGFNTLYVTSPNVVPEPASIAALSVGAIALMRRRKKK